MLKKGLLEIWFAVAVLLVSPCVLAKPYYESMTLKCEWLWNGNSESSTEEFTVSDGVIYEASEDEARQSWNKYPGDRVLKPWTINVNDGKALIAHKAYQKDTSPWFRTSSAMLMVDMRTGDLVRTSTSFENGGVDVVTGQGHCGDIHSN